MNERIPRKPGQPAKSDKHSDLYTDEDPKDTIHGLKFATTEDAEASVRKIKSSGRPHAHKIQAAIAMEQRAKVMGKAGAAAVYRSFINSMKEKTKEMREALESINEARVDKHEISGKVVVDGHVFSDAGKSGRSTYGRYSTPDPDYKKDPKEVGMHRNYKKPSSLSFSTLNDAKKWTKTQPKKSSEEIDRVHKKHAEFEKSMNEDVPVNAVGAGNIAGLGVGPQGEPGVNMKKKRKVMPFAIFVRKTKQ